MTARIPFPSQAYTDNFWRKVDKSGECWIWLGARQRRGYGSASKQRRNVPAHRVAYEMAFGPFRADLEICHRCDNPSCVRPSHLFAGTHLDNMRDCFAKGRHSVAAGTANPVRGEGHPAAVLTETMVHEIRRRHAAGEQTKQIALAFGVARATVYRVVIRKCWAHV